MEYNKLLPSVKRAWEAARPFQIEDAEFFVKNGRIVLGHKTGLGKTFISLLGWSRLKDIDKVLIVGTLSAISVWRRVLKEWGGADSIFIQGYSDPNWREALDSKSGIYLMTYATLRGLMENTPGRPNFDMLICDEIHRILRTRKSKVYKVAMLRLDFKYFIGCSATWSSRGPQDIWPVLHLISKSLFPSYWKFVETYCFVERTPFGVEIFGVKNVTALKKLLLDRFYVARTYKQVATQFISGSVSEEPIVRRIISLPMNEEQTAVYTQFKRDMVVTYKDKTLVTPTVLSLLTRLLQLSICPNILFPKMQRGAAIDWLLDQIAEEPHTVVFSPFAEVLEQVKLSLIGDNHLEDTIFILRGGMHPDEVDATITAWKSYKGIMLCTISFAQSFPLDTTNTAYMLGFSWDPSDNIQAEGRLRRMDSVLQTPCLVSYIVMEGSEYEAVKEVVNGKVATTRQFLSGYGKEHQNN